jgi:hypothetical protein
VIDLAAQGDYRSAEQLSQMRSLLYNRIDMVSFFPEAFMAAPLLLQIHPIIPARLLLYSLGSSFLGAYETEIRNHLEHEYQPGEEVE